MVDAESYVVQERELQRRLPHVPLEIIKHFLSLVRLFINPSVLWVFGGFYAALYLYITVYNNYVHYIRLAMCHNKLSSNRGCNFRPTKQSHAHMCAIDHVHVSCCCQIVCVRALHPASEVNCFVLHQKCTHLATVPYCIVLSCSQIPPLFHLCYLSVAHTLTNALLPIFLPSTLYLSLSYTIVTLNPSLFHTYSIVHPSLPPPSLPSLLPSLLESWKS